MSDVKIGVLPIHSHPWENPWVIQRDPAGHQQNSSAWTGWTAGCWVNLDQNGENNGRRYVAWLFWCGMTKHHVLLMLGLSGLAWYLNNSQGNRNLIEKNEVAVRSTKNWDVFFPNWVKGRNQLLATTAVCLNVLLVQKELFFWFSSTLNMK